MGRMFWFCCFGLGLAYHVCNFDFSVVDCRVKATQSEDYFIIIITKLLDRKMRLLEVEGSATWRVGEPLNREILSTC